MEKTIRPARAWLMTAAAVLLGGLMAFGIGAAAQAVPTPPPVDPASPYAFSGIVQTPEGPMPGIGITVTGDDDFEQRAVTGADGTWRISVPAVGTYTVTLDIESLPDGVTLRDPSFEEREFQVGSTTNVAVLFPFGDPPAATGPSDTPDPDSTADSGTEASSTGPTFLQQLYQRVISGLNFGLLLALAAIGITLIFGTTGVNNFAHGELLTFGGFMYFITTTVFAWPVPLAIAATLVISGAFGWFHDAAIFKPLRRKRVGLVQVLIVTIGLSIALRYLYQFIWGGGSVGLAVDNSSVVNMGGFNLSVSNLVSMGVAVLVLIGVGLFLTRTRIGKATRAVSDNAGLASASGIDVDRVIRIVWVVAGLLTGLAGVLYTYFMGANIRWDTGFSILLLLFASVTLGGLGSAFGAGIGAIIIGLTVQISTLWIPADLRYAVALIILILVLLVRPQGVLGRKERVG